MPTTPTDDEMLEAAIEAVTAEGQINIAPTISDRIGAILAKVKLASTWANNTAYVVGNVVMPTVRNGHKYRCIQAGTSEADSADEPEWPLGASAIITEGASDPILTWVEDGPELSQIYDVQKAIHQCWMEKAGKASNLYASGNAQMQQVYEQCLKQAQLYSSFNLA